MGYCIKRHAAKFFISVDKQPAALEAMIKLAKEKRNFHWFGYKDFINCTTLAEVLDVWFWPVKLDSDGNIIDILFVAEKAGDEDILWNTLAPYVKKGSYIEMGGEDGASWRWVFNGETCEEVSPKW